MNDKYGTYSKEDGEEVLSAIREENVFNENIDHNNFVPKNKELPLHDFLGKEKQDEVLLFKDNFDDLKKRKHYKDTDTHNDVFIDIVDKDSEKKSDFEIVEVLLNDLLNKVTEQSSLKSQKKKRRLSL